MGEHSLLINKTPGKLKNYLRIRALIGILLLIGMGIGVWQFSYWEPRLLPIKLIEVEGELHHHSSEMLEEIISKRLHGGILTADLTDLQVAAESLPWVNHATLRRVWPDRLHVWVEERKPLGRWNNDGLVTANGIVFRPQIGTIPAGLPLLEGKDHQAPEVVARYQEWRDRLMLVGHLIESLTVDTRGDWRIHLVTGTELRLGTRHIEDRLTRFIETVRQIETAGQPRVIDLRYNNGFAVTWAPPSTNTEMPNRNHANPEHTKPRGRG